ncbi:DNA transport protein TraD [Edwardsiella tarda]|nr:DNA transport protein TraD [Edwardsiella tarda]
MNHARQRGDMVIVYDRSCEFVKSYYDPPKIKFSIPLMCVAPIGTCGVSV